MKTTVPAHRQHRAQRPRNAIANSARDRRRPGQREKDQARGCTPPVGLREPSAADGGPRRRRASRRRARTAGSARAGRTSARADRQRRPGQDEHLVRQRDPGDLVTDAVDDLPRTTTIDSRGQAERRGIEKQPPNAAVHPAARPLNDRASGRESEICRARAGERRLRRGEPCHRHAERRARHVVQPDRSQLWIDSGSPPCSPQMPILRSGRVARPFSTAVLHQLPTTSSSSVWNGLAGRMPSSDVREQEAALGVVAAVAERHLGQVVRAEAEELRVLGDLVRVSAPRGISIIVPNMKSTVVPAAPLTGLRLRLEDRASRPARSRDRPAES